MTAGRVYAAGPQRSRMHGLRGHYVLASYAEASQCNLIPEGWPVRGWLLDSGAFSVWNSGGAPIDLDAYCAFIKANAHRLDGYIALDVIPGEPERPATAAEIEAALKASLANLATMRERGLEPWPVFHEGDPDWVLDSFVAQDFGTICLAGTISRGEPELIPWLLSIFERYPSQRFHGLAMTQRDILCDERLPFWSVDSTTWHNPVTRGLHETAWYFRDLDNGFRRLIEQEMVHVAMTAMEYLAEHGPRLRAEAEAKKKASEPPPMPDRQLSLLDETA